MDKQRWFNTFFLGILGLTIGFGGVGVGDLSAQLTTGDLYGHVTDNHAEIERVLSSSLETKEKESLLRETIDRQYQNDVDRRADVDPQTYPEGSHRQLPCFHQEVTITWDGAQKDAEGRNEIHGSEADDVIRGTDQADLIVGHGGEDIICGGGGDDLIYGDDEEMFSSNGSFDLIDGEAGDDFISGGGGRDWLHGSEGEDRLLGGWDEDHLFGGADRDLLVGMMGADVHRGGNGNDVIHAVASDDSQHDESDGEDGHDVCHVDKEEADSLTLTWCEVEFLGP